MGRKRRKMKARGNARKGPYSRVYGPWREEWARAGLSGTQYAVMLAMCQWLEFDARGRAYAFRPRRELARELGKSEGALKQATQRLVRAGLLEPKSTAHRGSAATYWVMPSMPWPLQKGSAVDTPLKGSAVDTPKDEKGVSGATPKGYAVDTPITKGKGSLSALLTSGGSETPVS